MREKYNPARGLIIEIISHHSRVYSLPSWSTIRQNAHGRGLLYRACSSSSCGNFRGAASGVSVEKPLSSASLSLLPEYARIVPNIRECRRCPKQKSPCHVAPQSCACGPSHAPARARLLFRSPRRALTAARRARSWLPARNHGVPEPRAARRDRRSAAVTSIDMANGAAARRDGASPSDSPVDDDPKRRAARAPRHRQNVTARIAPSPRALVRHNIQHHWETRLARRRAPRREACAIVRQTIRRIDHGLKPMPASAAAALIVNVIIAVASSREAAAKWRWLTLLLCGVSRVALRDSSRLHQRNRACRASASDGPSARRETYASMRVVSAVRP